MADGFDGDSTHFHVGVGEAVIREELGKAHARLHAGDLDAFLDDARGRVVHFVADIRVFFRRSLQNSADQRVVHDRFGDFQRFLVAERRTYTVHNRLGGLRGVLAIGRTDGVEVVVEQQHARGHFEKKIRDGRMNERRESAKKRQEPEREATKRAGYTVMMELVVMWEESLMTQLFTL